ncbi:sigma-70 family RNA polymerase sigma factor [Oceanobacillus locisalsi]|uniref:Sigma-70 family RNA polymerase sigma factor n=1 Tax=Oceanobacillus locisalsi TaxID=546107 RepID=A0ABW3NB04_9BACI
MVKEDKEDKIMETFLNEYAHVFNNPILNKFIQDENNYDLLKQSILYPTAVNKEKVNKAFKNYYKHIQKEAYINKLIKFFSIDYDKKMRKIQDRYPVVLDNDIHDQEGTTMKDLIESTPQNIAEQSYGYEIRNHIEDEKLHNALTLLSYKQLAILDKLYLKNMTMKEIAESVNTTPQNISKQHKSILKKLKKTIQTKEEG